RSRDEVDQRPADEDLAGPGERRQVARQADGDAAHLAGDDLALAGVQAGPDLAIRGRARRDQRGGAADGPRRTVEGGLDLRWREGQQPAALAVDVSPRLRFEGLS